MPDSIPTTSNKYEVTVWRARPFIFGLIGFFGFMVALLAVVAGLTVSWTNHTWPLHGPVENPSSTPGWNTQSPQLEVKPIYDLQAVRKSEYHKLHATRWTDTTRGYAVIPIERAMALLAEAQASGQLTKVLPEPKSATPVELQNQKSNEAVSKPGGP